MSLGDTVGDDNDEHGGGVHIALVPPCRLVVRSTAGARVIGKGGESIRSIRSRSGAKVNVLQDELPEVLRRRKECIVVVSCGEVHALHSAIVSILDRVFDRSGLPDPTERARDRPYVVDVVIPERAGGPLVGPGGEHVKALIDEMGCDIHVIREPLVGIAAQKRVRVLSRDRDRVDATVKRLQDILGQFSDKGTLRPEHFELREMLPTEEEQERLRRVEAGEEVPVRLLLAQGETAMVVGKLGQNVRKLRDIAHVSIDDADAPPFDPSERICSAARAPLTDRLRVARLVIADLASKQIEGDSDAQALGEGARPVEIRLVLPTSRFEDVRSLLDAEANTLSHGSRCLLDSDTGATTQVYEADSAALDCRSNYLIVNIAGSEEQVAVCIWRVHQTLEPWEPEDVPPRWDPVQTRENEVPGEGAKGQGKGARDQNSATRSGIVGESIEPPRRRLLADPAQRTHPDQNSATRSGIAGESIESPQRNSVPDPEEPVRTNAGQNNSTRSGMASGPIGPPQRSSLSNPVETVRAKSNQDGFAVHDINGCVPQTWDEEAQVVYQTPQCVQVTTTCPSEEVQFQKDVKPAASTEHATTNRHGEQAQEFAHEETHSSLQDPSTAVPQLCDASNLSVWVVVPSDGSASFLASDSSGVARRAGVKLTAWPANSGAGTPPALEIVGSLHSNAIACYLIQVQLWLAHNVVRSGTIGNEYH